MQGKSSIVVWSLFVLLILTLLVVPLVKVFFDSSQKAASTARIAYSAAANICVDGCRAHENWIEFHLVSDNYVESSLRLRTSLFWAQILTYGIGFRPCVQQNGPEQACVDMEISHRLLSGLIDLNLVAVTQLRDRSSWWLEYQLEN